MKSFLAFYSFLVEILIFFKLSLFIDFDKKKKKNQAQKITFLLRLSG